MNDTALRVLFSRFLVRQEMHPPTLASGCDDPTCPGFFRDGDTRRWVACDECCRTASLRAGDEDVREFIRRAFRRALSRRIGDVAVRDYIRDRFGTFQEFAQ